LGGVSEHFLLERQLLLHGFLGQEDEGQELPEGAAEPALGHSWGRPRHAILLPGVRLLLVPTGEKERKKKKKKREKKKMNTNKKSLSC